MTDSTPTPETAELRQLRQTLADGMAKVGRIYSINPVLSHLYVALFVSARPLSLEVIADRAGVAKSTASVALRELERWHLVRRTVRRPGDRREYFEPRTDPVAILGEWMRTFVAREVEEGARCADDVEALLPAALSSLQGDEHDVIAARVAGFIRLTRLFKRGHDLINATGVARLAENVLRLLSR